MQRVDQAPHTVSAFLMALAVLGTQACLPDFDVASSEDAVCEPNSEVACYTGIIGTEGLGICTAGLQACDAEGAKYGPCMGSGLPKVEICSTPEDENCDDKAGCGGDCVWTRRFEREEILSSYYWYEPGVGSLAVDDTWNTIIVGSYGDGNTPGWGPGTVDLGGGPLPCKSHCGFVGKLDPLGTHLWSVSLDNHAGESVALLSNGDIVVVARGGSSTVASVCGLDSDGSHGFVVVKLDPEGRCKQGWGVRIPVKLVKRPSVVADGAGNVYVAFAAESGKVGNISVGGQSVLVQLDPAGKVSAVETFGDSVTTPVALAIEPGGEDVYLLGDSWDNEVKFGPKITLSFSHRHDVFVAKYAPSFIGTADGPWRWARPMGGQDGDVAHAGDMLVTQGGKIVVAGAYAYPIKCGGLSPEFMPDGNDLRIALLEPHTGGCIWAYSFGSTGSTGQQTIQYLRMRHEPGGKNLILSGLYEGAELFKKGNGGLSLPPSTYNDIFVAKLDDKLEPTWVRGFGAENLDVLYGLAVDSGGSIRLAGVGRGVDFGCGAASDEEGNFFITRLSP